MRPFYIRWGAILIIGIAIATFGFLRYAGEVRTVTPESVIRDTPSGEVRILGTVAGGSLALEEAASGEDASEARFRVGGEPGLAIHYIGPKPENLRELKTVVIRGRWEPVSKEFQADKISVVPNYRFIAAAYLVAVLPLGLFLFAMERRVRLLFYEIKETTVYEPEKIFDNG